MLIGMHVDLTEYRVRIVQSNVVLGVGIFGRAKVVRGCRCRSGTGTARCTVQGTLGGRPSKQPCSSCFVELGQDGIH